jgi:hypothetical protein
MQQQEGSLQQVELQVEIQMVLRPGELRGDSRLKLLPGGLWQQLLLVLIPQELRSLILASMELQLILLEESPLELALFQRNLPGGQVILWHWQLVLLCPSKTQE